MTENTENKTATPDKPEPAKMAKKGWGRWKTFFVSMIVMFFIVGGILAGLLVAFWDDLPGLGVLTPHPVSLSTHLYDVHGELIRELSVEQRTWVTLDEVPLHLVQAVISIEDARFYDHWGLDLWGISRAMWVNVMHGRIVQGGSTITQQLAKNMFLTRERTIQRKAKEALLAIRLEKNFEKDEILEKYLNWIYFGNRAYGVEAASRTYFGKNAHELTLSEAAVLAGIPRSPNNNNPIDSMEKAVARKEAVLRKMYEYNYISSEEFATSVAEPIVVYRTEMGTAPYFVEYVRKQLEESYGANAVYRGGMKVYTTLDLSMQDYAQRAVNNGLLRVDRLAQPYLTHIFTLQEKPEVQAAFLAMDPKNGHIRAMVGGRDFQRYQFNRAVQARRQPGSAFKPFIYTAAIDNGFTAADVIVDSPFVRDNPDGSRWTPENFNGKFQGETTVRRGLTHSKNVVTVKLLDKIGTSTAINYAHRMGIQSKLNRDLTLALGTGEVSLLELVTGYSTLANLGVRVEPMAILRVVDSSGQTLEENISEATEVLNAGAAYVVTTILQDVVNKGTGTSVRRDGFSGTCAGKTGTTNDYSDAWFMGFTPDLVAGVWFGYDQRRSIGRLLTGGQVAAPVWTEFMIRATQGQMDRPFPQPEGIVHIPVCYHTGDTCLEGCKGVIEEVFMEGTEPQPCEESRGGIGNFWEADLHGSGNFLSTTARPKYVSWTADTRLNLSRTMPGAGLVQPRRIYPTPTDDAGDQPQEEERPPSAF